MKSFLLQKSGAVVVLASLLGGCAMDGMNQPMGVYNPQNPVYAPVAQANSNPIMNAVNGMSNTSIGAVSGAAAGGLLGAAIARDGKKNQGALIGAVAGGLLGGVIGNNYHKGYDGTTTSNNTPFGALSSVLNGSGANVTQMGDGSTKVSIAGDTSFNSGSSMLRENFMANLNNIANVIKQSPNGRTVVVGHTDSMGNPQANQQLSLARANAVRGYLANRGVNINSITAYGQGESQPVADNGTEAGRASNRRVEIFVYPQ